MASTDKTIQSFLLPRLQDILFITIYIGSLLLGPRMLNMDGDLPRHILTGKLILETRSVPATEPFAYPYQDKPFVSHAHDWITVTFFYLVFRFTGLAGMVILSALLLAFMFTFLCRYIFKQSELFLSTLFLLIWGAGITSLHWITRPHLFSMLFFIVWIIWLDKIDRGKQERLWHFPFLMLLWANMHGEFVIGFLALLAYGAGWIWLFLFNRSLANKRTGLNFLLILVLSSFASLLNPSGLASWKTVLGYIGNNYLMSRTYEMRQPDFSQPEFLVLLGLLVFSIFLLSIKNKKIPTAHAFLLAGFSAMSLIAGRNIHLYGIAAPFVLAGAIEKKSLGAIFLRLENSLSRIDENLKGSLWPAMTVVISCVLIASTPIKQIYQFSNQKFPVQATKWLMDNPQSGRLFNELNWGGYLALHLWPGQSVFVDSVADTTGELTLEYESVLTLSPQKNTVLAKYHIEWAVIKTDSILASALKREGWAVLYQDPIATILRKP